MMSKLSWTTVRNKWNNASRLMPHCNTSESTKTIMQAVLKMTCTDNPDWCCFKLATKSPLSKASSKHTGTVKEIRSPLCGKQLKSRGCLNNVTVTWERQRWCLQKGCQGGYNLHGGMIKVLQEHPVPFGDSFRQNSWSPYKLAGDFCTLVRA